MAYQLAGAKKVQQDLARPGVLERFLESEADAQLLRSVFAGALGLVSLCRLLSINEKLFAPNGTCASVISYHVHE